jgi:serine/threonine protein phosphatase PrpC
MTQNDRFGGRFRLLSSDTGPLEVRDEAPWLQCVNCRRPAAADEAYCTECGARLIERTYAAFLSRPEQPAGPACLLDAALEQPAEVLPAIWYDQIEGDRRLTIPAPIDGSAVPATLDLLEVIRLALALADGLHSLHGAGLLLGGVSRDELRLQNGRWRLRTVNRLQRAADADPDAAVRDLQQIGELIEALSATPRTTQRLDETAALPQPDAARGLAEILRDLRTGGLRDAAAMSTRLQQLLRELTEPLMLIQTAGGASDVGRVRQHNEDSMLTLQFHRNNDGAAEIWGCYAVADGMGGHAAGERASGLALQALTEHVAAQLLLPHADRPTGYDGGWIGRMLADAVQSANTTVVQQSRVENNDMGTTLVAALVIGDRVTLANVGDSRAYLWRDGALQRLTRDHSLVQRLVDLGQIRPEDVYTHPQRNAVTASIGDRMNVRVDISSLQVYEGDVLLICSDGQWEMTRDPQMAQLIGAHSDVQTAAAALIAAANAAGGEDNVTSVLVRFSR